MCIRDRFGLSEINWGIIPAGIVTKALAGAINQRDALYYIMTGEAFDGARAAQIDVYKRQVVANPSFGFQVAVEGGGYTWSVNSHENQLTPWSNDPVTDRLGEVLFLRDEDSGELWGPTALPIRDEAAPYVVRHGQGLSLIHI